MTGETNTGGKAKIKLTPKQNEIINLMRKGYPLMVGQSETTGSIYYMIASTHNNGYGNTYLRSNVFSNLLQKKLIYLNNYSMEYELTQLGNTIEI